MATDHPESDPPPLYISITGLAIKRRWMMPVFWLLAIRSMAQAKAAEGCLSADARMIDGIHHTRSVWRSRADVHAYINSGIHARAMRAFRWIAVGKTYGYATDEVPDWKEVRRIWEEHGRLSKRYGGSQPKEAQEAAIRAASRS